MSGGPVLVTGAAGFAGSHLVELLDASTLVCWTRDAPPTDIAQRARWQQLDLLDRDAVRAAVREVRPSQVYHLAGVPHVAGSWENTTATLQGNLLGTHHLLDALRRADVRA